MLRTGTPVWVMHLFGIAAMTAGFVIWHKLGSLNVFWMNPARVTPANAYGLLATLNCIIAAQLALSG